MITEEIAVSKKEVDETFDNLAPIIEEITNRYSKDLDAILDKLLNAQALTNEEIRTYMLKLATETYMFGISKDASLLRQECATTILKEAQAREYNQAEGTQQNRSNISILNTKDKQVVNMIYTSVSNLLKTKLDEAHRTVNVLNSILISRNAEAKLESSNTDLGKQTLLS